MIRKYYCLFCRVEFIVCNENGSMLQQSADHSARVYSLTAYLQRRLPF